MFFQLLGGRSEVSGKFRAGSAHDGRFGYKELRRDVLEYSRSQHPRLETPSTLRAQGGLWRTEATMGLGRNVCSPLSFSRQ